MQPHFKRFAPFRHRRLTGTRESIINTLLTVQVKNPLTFSLTDNKYMTKKKRRPAQPDPYRGQRGSLPLWKLQTIITAELHRVQSPVTRIDPATMDIDDLIRRAITNR